MTTKIKSLVSRHKRRFESDKFNLDLTYILPNIIAMGFPAKNVEALYRNNINDVVKFLDERHGSQYKVYNLCSERHYDSKKFYNRVECFPFDDHNPPLFEMIDQCCKNLRQWLSEDIDNVVVIHCKAGKGRTGVIISAYLLFTNMFHTASDALAFYDKTRTSDHKGVTIPSQRRYVEYYHKTLYSPKDYYLIPMFITEIIIDHPPFVASLYIVVSERNNILYTSKEYTIPKNTQITIALPTPLKVEGDINLEFYTKSILVKGKLCNYWFNTFFVKNENDANVVVNDFFYLLTYKKNEIDKAVKDKDEKIFNNEFQVTTKMIAELED